jgi:hypothetical protein
MLSAFCSLLSFGFGRRITPSNSSGHRKTIFDKIKKYEAEPCKIELDLIWQLKLTFAQQHQDNLLHYCIFNSRQDTVRDSWANIAAIPANAKLSARLHVVTEIGEQFFLYFILLKIA